MSYWKEKNRKTYDLKDYVGGESRTVTILTPDAALLALHGFPAIIFDVSASMEEKTKELKKFQKDIDGSSTIERIELEHKLVKACLIDPIIWEGDDKLCPPDQVTMRELAADTSIIFSLVMQQSGLIDADEVSKIARMFRNDRDGQGD